MLFRAWPGAFPDSVCETALEAFTGHDLQPAGVQGAQAGASVHRDQRAASKLSIDTEHWVGALASHFALLANQVWGLEQLQSPRVNDTMMDGHVALPNGLGLSYAPAGGDPELTGVAPNELTTTDWCDPIAGTP